MIENDILNALNFQNMINEEILPIANTRSIYRSYIKLLTESSTLIKTNWQFEGQIFSNQNAIKSKTEEWLHSTNLFFFYF